VIQAADPPAAVAPAPAQTPADKPADVVVVSRDTQSEVLASRDTPLPLTKARRTEDALLRQAIFLTSTLTVVRPAADAGEQTLRWSYQPYLQRQLCFTSITGLFSCAGAEVEELTEKAAGEAPLPAATGQPGAAPNPTAEAARLATATALRTRADALFADDRRLKLDPMLKAAGVSVQRAHAAAGHR
jgi:hypothetical protein